MTGPHPFVDDGIEADPFAADFIIASVERLDEPQQPASSQTRVASLEIAHPSPQR